MVVTSVSSFGFPYSFDVMGRQFKVLFGFFQQGIYPGFKILNMEGLGYVIVCPGTEGNHFAVHIIERGDYDNGCVDKPRVSSEHPGQFKTVGFGHHQVKEYDVGSDSVRNFHYP